MLEFFLGLVIGGIVGVFVIALIVGGSQ